MASIQNDGSLRNVHRFEPLPNSGGFQGFMDTIRLGVSLSPTGSFLNLDETTAAFLSNSFMSIMTSGPVPSQISYLTNASPIPPGTIPPGRALTPLVVNPTTPSTYILPSSTTYSGLQPKPASGGGFIIPVVNIGSANATFQASPPNPPLNPANSGSKVIPPGTNSNVFITFTNPNCNYTVR